jgi:hypothetical protein
MCFGFQANGAFLFNGRRAFMAIGAASERILLGIYMPQTCLDLQTKSALFFCSKACLFIRECAAILRIELRKSASSFRLLEITDWNLIDRGRLLDFYFEIYWLSV